jgi:proteic killer suppression protein
MIKSIKHKGLKLFYESGNTKGIQSKHASRLRLQLTALATAIEISDLDLPGYGLHELKGARKGTWSIAVNGNWRLTFEFLNGHVYLLNYEDYH